MRLARDISYEPLTCCRRGNGLSMLANRNHEQDTDVFMSTSQANTIEQARSKKEIRKSRV